MLVSICLRGKEHCREMEGEREREREKGAWNDLEHNAPPDYSQDCVYLQSFALCAGTAMSELYLQSEMDMNFSSLLIQLTAMELIEFSGSYHFYLIYVSTFRPLCIHACACVCAHFYQWSPTFSLTRCHCGLFDRRSSGKVFR